MNLLNTFTDEWLDDLSEALAHRAAHRRTDAWQVQNAASEATRAAQVAEDEAKRAFEFESERCKRLL